MLRLEIVTPEKRAFDADVDSVTVPTASGEAGILPNHAPLVSALRPGILTYSQKNVINKLAVSSGFIEVNADRVAVMVDTAETAGEIDIDAARASREAAEKSIASLAAAPVEETEAAREQFDAAQARLTLSQKPP
jgi:F-type H+-transporting ATPase subunit epsilon